MKIFNLEISSSDFFTKLDNVYYISVITPIGSIGIMKDHSPLSCSITKEVKIKTNNGEKVFEIEEGFIIFEDNLARLSIKQRR
tara:strand:- start:2717 stop:2965 length:249 start_codon:yes stop_codon:yes gene_type:complete